MEVTHLPEIVYHVSITLTEENLSKMEEYVRNGEKYTGAYEFATLVKKLREAVGRPIPRCNA